MEKGESVGGQLLYKAVEFRPVLRVLSEHRVKQALFLGGEKLELLH